MINYILSPGSKSSLDVANLITNKLTSNSKLFVVDDDPKCYLGNHGFHILSSNDIKSKIKKECSSVLYFISWCSDFAIRIAYDLKGINKQIKLLLLPDRDLLYLLIDKFLYLSYLGENVFTKIDYNSTKKIKFIKKPRLGSGSKGISDVISKNDLYIECDNNFFQQKYFGKEYSLEGFVDGLHFYPWLLSRRLMNNYSCNVIYSLDLNEDKYHSYIENISKKIKSVLYQFSNSKKFFIHLEFIVEEQDPIPRIIDMSPRVGGFGIGGDYLLQVTGINTRDIVVKTLNNSIKKFDYEGYSYLKSNITIFVPYKKGILEDFKLPDIPSDEFKFYTINQFISVGKEMCIPICDSHRICQINFSFDLQTFNHRKKINIIKHILSLIFIRISSENYTALELSNLSNLNYFL